MKRPIVVQDFSQLNYALKAGKAPEPPKAKHKGNWSLYYGLFLIEPNKPYSACMKLLRECKMQGMRYPNKEKFSIKPFTNK